MRLGTLTLLATAVLATAGTFAAESRVGKLVKRCRGGERKACDELTDLVRRGDRDAVVEGIDVISDRAVLLQTALREEHAGGRAVKRLLALHAEPALFLEIARGVTWTATQELAIDGIEDAEALVAIASASDFLDLWEAAVMRLADDAVVPPPDLSAAAGRLRERLHAFAGQRGTSLDGSDRPRYAPEEIAWDDKVVQALVDGVKRSSWPRFKVPEGLTGLVLTRGLRTGGWERPLRLPPGKMTFCAGYAVRHGSDLERTTGCQQVVATLAAGHCYTVLMPEGSLANTIRFEVGEMPSLEADCAR